MMSSASCVVPHRVGVPVPTNHRRRASCRARRRTENVRVRSKSEEEEDRSLFEGDDVPEALKGLTLDANGDLIDTKTGKALNDFGATRFDLAVRAMRGEYDPVGVSTEKEEGQIYDTLTQFPSDYTFQAAGKSADLTEGAIDDLKGKIAHICGCEIVPAQVQIKERGSSGKFISVWVTCTVHSGEMVQEVLTTLKADDRVMMIC